jgi:hypothetical protein
VPYTGPFGNGYTNTGFVDGIVVSNTTINGTLGNSNTGTISPNGIEIVDSAIISADYNGLAIWDQGSITGGISIDSTSNLKGMVWVDGVTFNGDVYNAGSISGAYGILVSASPFTGNITNAGSIFSGSISGGNGIEVTHAILTGNISNSGMISFGSYGIYILQSSVSGTISNTGTITGNIGIDMDAGSAPGSGPRPPLSTAPALNIFDSGTIGGTSGTAVKLVPATMGNNTFTLGPGYHIDGNVLGAGGDTFQLGGTGSDNFDLSEIGSQYTGFAHFSVIGAIWTVSGSGSNWHVESGAVMEVGTGADLWNTTLDGGELVLLSGGAAKNVAFGDDVPATLALENPTSLTGVLSNWHIGDTIDFTHTALAGASIGNNGAVLNIITSDGLSCGYSLAGLQADTQVTLQSDGDGGTFVKLAAGVTPITAAHYLPGDFNHDGLPDLLWSGSDGSLVEWQMQNGQPSGAGIHLLGSEGAGWQVVGVGDFNHDGTSDILLGNADGTLVEWQMSNGQQAGPGIQLLTSATGWQVAAVGDFNHDGTDDILLHNTDGTVIEWQMQNGHQSGPGIQLLGKEGANWQVAGVGDFNHDGTADILWQASNGTLIEWQMNNGHQSGPGIQLLGNDGFAWKVAGVGDFNHDGTSDILLHHADGTLIEWQMQNGQQAGPGIQLMGKEGLTWQTVGVSDFNHDGTDDLLLRGVDGTVVEWQMQNGHQAGPGIALVTGHDGGGWHLIA